MITAMVSGAQTAGTQTSCFKKLSYTIKRRVYVFICLFVRSFALSSVLLTNRLTQALKIPIDYSVNFSWTSEHIFNFLRFVIQKL